MDADEVEIRVLGCLIEKQRTTPDVYPLSLNSLRLACNQSTNRDPVVDYDEHTIHEALHRLHRRGWARLTSGAGSRTVKYRHLLDNALSLEPEQLSLLAVLLLRGPQTPGELKQRSERLYPLETLADVEAVLASLVERELVARLERRPGQKEERYVQQLGASAEQVDVHEGPRNPYPTSAAASLGERVAALESEVATLRHVLEELAGPIEPS
ncbi:MAG: YceH family protein [Gaiellaceae bacterium]